jgi:hypothetical protein
MNTKNDQIGDFIERLSNEIKVARALSLNLTAHILEMARIDLRMTLHSISDEEFRTFTEAVAHEMSLQAVSH